MIEGHGEPVPMARLAREESVRMAVNTHEVAKHGIGFGTALAIAISWSVNKSILWAIIHGILSWVYVVYFAAMKS